jgi:DNA repair photolyase
LFRPIYEPRSRAREYCDNAINIYDVCNHGCVYCYARRMYERFHGEGSFDKTPEARADIVGSVKAQLLRERKTGLKIMLCFTCDPYPALIDTTPTREVIKAIKESGNHVQILTKGGARAMRDFDLLDSGDSFGVTITGFDSNFIEPKAAPEHERIKTLVEARAKGIKTWVSCEPVYMPEAIYYLIRTGDYVDFLKIGKLNYYPSNIRWGEFGRHCEELCQKYGRNYYIKEDLRAEMAKQ